MLVLTRKAGECLHLGDNIVVKVVKVRGSSVQLGIEAPPEVAILRSELLPQKPTGGHIPVDVSRDPRPTPASIVVAAGTQASGILNV